MLFSFVFWFFFFFFFFFLEFDTELLERLSGDPNIETNIDAYRLQLAVKVCVSLILV